MESFPIEGRPITELGIPNDIERIDAAFVWGHNKKTYLISGRMYWRYNEDDGYVEYGYPRDMSIWSRVQIPVSSAFQYLDGECAVQSLVVNSSFQFVVSAYFYRFLGGPVQYMMGFSV